MDIAIGLNAPVPKGISAGFSVQFSVPVDFGEYATIKNRQSTEINGLVDRFNANDKAIKEDFADFFMGDEF